MIPQSHDVEFAFPQVCCVTGDTDGVRNVLLNEELYDAPWWVVVLAGAAGTDVEVRRVSFRLPLSKRGEELSRSLDGTRHLVQQSAGACAIGSAFAGALYVLFGQGSYTDCLLIIGLGCALALTTMAFLELKVVPRRRPILCEAAGGWLRVKVPSGRAAKLIGNQGWPMSWAEALESPRE